jgi:hypothetical protein
MGDGDRVLPRDVPVPLKCFLIGAGIRGRLCNLSELVTILGQKRLSAFDTPEEGWAAADREAAALTRLLDLAGPDCQVPERVLSATPAPAPPDERLMKLVEGVRNRDREAVRAKLLEFDAWYELMSEEAADANASAKTL